LQQLFRVFSELENLLCSSGMTKHCTGPRRTAPYSKISGDGFPECLGHIGHTDILLQKGMGPYFGPVPLI